MVIPAKLPKAETYTVSISEKDIRFRADYDEIAHVAFEHGEVFRRISQFSQVGVVEYDSEERFPDYITATAYVELRRAQA